MPITLRKINAQVKDPTTGDMIPAGLLSSDSLEAIEAAETAAVAAVGAKQAVSEAAIELKGATTLASIPADYTTLDNEVDDLKTQITDIDNSLYGTPVAVTEEDISSLFSFVDKYQIKVSDGDISGGTNTAISCTTDYIDISDYAKIDISMRKLRSNPVTTAGLAFYDEYKVFIGGVSENVDTSMSGITQETRTITIPTNAKYLRTTWFGTGSSFYPSAVFSCIATTKETRTGGLVNELDNALYTYVDQAWKTSANQLTGWNTGYYGGDAGSELTNQGSNKYILAHFSLSASNYEKINQNDFRFCIITPPSDNAVSVREYNTETRVVTAIFGAINTTTHPELVGKPIKLTIKPGHSYAVSMGKFDNGDASDYASDQTFIDTIKLQFVFSKVADSSVVNRLKNINNVYTSDDDTKVFDTFDDVIAAYDALLNNNTGFMQKQTITVGSTTNYTYHITLGAYNKAGARGTRDTEQTRKQILILSGVHGYERSAVSSVYAVIRDLLKNANLTPALSCTIKVLPVGSPSGFNANTRLNGNDVNINRNFDSSNWTQTPQGNDYSGPSAGSEDETKIIQQWINNNLANGVLFIDVHNSSYVNEISAFLSSDIAIQDPSYKKTYLKAVNKIIPYWMNVAGLKSSDYIFGYTTVSSNGGTSISYAQEKGITAYTLELSWNIKGTGLHSNYTIGRGAEILGAILKQFTEENQFIPDI